MVNEIEDISDNLLVTRIRCNDKDAFKTLYDRYNKKIYFFSLRYLSNNIEAEELVQSVFINVWEHRESLDANISVKNYIYKAAVNYIYNYLKKKAIRARFVESEIKKGEIHSNLTYEQVFYHDLERSISAIVEALPSQQKKIFQLSRYEGLTHKEIAKKLDLSERTVENQIFRSLKKIRNILKGGISLVLMLISF
jgi:RNA polymerase sigma-70 factor (ECF subfamily)